MPASPVIPVISRRGYLRGAKETVWGTAVAASFDLPTHTRGLAGDLTKASPDLAFNTRAKDLYLINARRWAAGQIGGPAYGTSFGNIIMGATGADAVTAQPVAPASVVLTPSTTGGTLATASYFYRVSAVSGAGETLASVELSAAVTGPTGSVAITWAEVPGAIGYNVYGRTTGAELRLLAAAPTSPFVGSGTGVQVTVPGGVTTFTDTGAITPAGALPVAAAFGARHLFTFAAAVPSYSFEQNRGGITASEQFTGCVIGQLDLLSKFDQNDGWFDWRASMLGAFATTPPITATTFIRPVDRPAAAAKASLAYGGKQWGKVMEFTALINNSPEAIKVGYSTVDINYALATTLVMQGTARIVFDAFSGGAIANEYTDWYQNNPITISVVWPFEDGASFEIKLASTIIEKFQLRDAGPYVEASFDYKVQDPITNAQFALANTQAAAY